MNLQSGHFTEAEIQQFLSGRSEEIPGERIGSHLAECSRCLQIAVQAQRAQLGFTKAFSANPGPYPECPDEDTLAELAAGYAPANARELAHHADQCNFCGPLLKQLKKDFSQDFSAEEEEFLGRLKTSGSQWQQDYVRRKIPPNRRFSFTGFFNAIGQSMSPRAWRWAAAGAAVLALGILTPLEGPIIMDAYHLAEAKNSAIKAASEQPIIKMRIPNASYGHYAKEMGGPLVITSSSLREAQSIVLKKEQAGPLDRKWLQVEGLTLLLDGTPSKAAIAFEKALSEGLEDPSLEIELAASYFESNRPYSPDICKAINLLGGVLSRPKLSGEDKKTATYNLAIAYESMDDWPNAAAQWEDYLAMDDSSEWAAEAKSRLKKAKLEIKTLSGKQLSPSPSSFLEQPALQLRVEEYQEIAIESWLPQAIQEPRSEEARATRKLAELLATNYSDPFLKNLLSASGEAEAPAFEALKSASRENKTGHYTDAGADAVKAALLFARHNNLPGELYAQFEEVFAAQQALNSDKCAMLARKLKNRLVNTEYRWLKAQAALERAACLNQLQDHDGALAELESSEIKKNTFPVLGLRILGLAAGIYLLQKNDEVSWQKSVEGLHRVAEASYPWQRVYQFYSVLEQYAENKGYLHAQRALLLQAIAIQEAAPREDESVILKGVLYGRLSTLYLKLKEDAQASEAAAKYNLLLSQAAQDATTDKYVVFQRTGLAEAQRQLGNPEMAARTLEPAVGLIARITDKLIALDFYRVLGDSYRQSHRLDESATIYECGIVIAEQMLSSVKDEDSRLKWINGVDPIYRGLILVLLEQKKTEDALKLWEWYGGRSAGTPEQTANQSWESLQKKIFRPIAFSTSPTRLAYAVFEDRLQIWTAQANEIKGHSIKIKQADLERKVSDFGLQCATRPPPKYNMDELHKSAKALGALFLQPVQTELEASREVLVELDPRLSRLPVAALMTPAGRYFGEDYAITISPGVLRENALRTAQHVASDGSVLLATGAPARGQDSLIGLDDLEFAVRKTFNKTVFANAEKDSWNEVSLKLKDSDVFIFTGHGVPEGTNTALVYGNLLLNAEAFPPKSLQHLRFAVLAACSSGTGGQGSALLETGSLVHAFHAAGVPNIVVTRWNVDSEATTALLSSFIDHLSRNEEISTAMFHARNDFRQLLHHGENYRHPYWWAGLELVGRAN